MAMNSFSIYKTMMATAVKGVEKPDEMAKIITDVTKKSDLHFLLGVATDLGFEQFLRDLFATNLTEIVMKDLTGTDGHDKEPIDSPKKAEKIDSPKKAKKVDSPKKATESKTTKWVEKTPRTPMPQTKESVEEPAEKADHGDFPPLGSPFKSKKTKQVISWADLADEVESVQSDATEKAAEIAKKKSVLPYASRMKLENVPYEELDDAINMELARLESLKPVVRIATPTVERINTPKPVDTPKPVETPKPEENKVDVKHSETPKRLILTPKFADKAAEKRFKKYHSIPVEPYAEAMLLNEGFNVVKGKSKKPVIQATNLHPEKLRTTTSLKWIFFNDSPILPYDSDWNLWSYTYDAEGRVVPIGWIYLGNNRYRAYHKSVFIHERLADGSWIHFEELYDDATGKIKLVQVSVQYLKYCLTPAHCRPAKFVETD